MERSFGTIGSKAQVSMPKEARESLGAETSDRVAEGDRTAIPQPSSEDNPFEKFIGITGPFPGGEEGIKAWIDDMRSDED